MDKYIIGDIHDVIKTIKSNSIQLIYTDPPFNTTQASWDNKPLKWDILFKEMWRVLVPNGIIILHASMPFTYELLKYQKPKYHYIWEKNVVTCPFIVKYQPLRKHEEIFIYYKKRGTYNPQMTGNKFYKKRTVTYGGNEKYYGECKVKKNKYTNEGGHKGNYPTTILKYPIRKNSNGITRCDEMINYFIKTYSNEGDTVLNMTCCNKIVGDLVVKLKRHYIGVDINEIK